MHYLTELGDADHEEDTVPAEERDRAELRVGPDTVDQVRQRQQGPGDHAQLGAGVWGDQGQAHDHAGSHVGAGDGRVSGGDGGVGAL